MADNKTQPTTANVAEFVRCVPDKTRRAEARVILAMMRRASGDKPVLWGPTIIGFGIYRYRTAAGREGDMPIIAYSPRKSAHVLYIMPGLLGFGPLLAKLGPHKTGKACLYIKRLTEIDLGTLEKLINACVVHMRAKAEKSKPRQRKLKPVGGPNV